MANSGPQLKGILGIAFQAMILIVSGLWAELFADRICRIIAVLYHFAVAD